jgi:hypothetical protein
MKAIDSRIRRLQDRLCPENGQPQCLWVAIRPSYGPALDLDKCVQILGEGGFLPTGRFGCLNFLGIPEGLNARELEQFLRKNGAETCGFGGNQKQGGPGGALPLGETSWSNQVQMSADRRR